MTTAFRIGSNPYQSTAYHVNAIHYVPFDDSFTISDRNPKALLKVSATAFGHAGRELHASSNLGDVQRLPGGNTLITYSSDGQIVEVDSDWNEVQTVSVRVGYSSWRPTLYGTPNSTLRSKRRGSKRNDLSFVALRVELG